MRSDPDVVRRNGAAFCPQTCRDARVAVRGGQGHGFTILTWGLSINACSSRSRSCSWRVPCLKPVQQLVDDDEGEKDSRRDLHTRSAGRVDVRAFKCEYALETSRIFTGRHHVHLDVGEVPETAVHLRPLPRPSTYRSGGPARRRRCRGRHRVRQDRLPGSEGSGRRGSSRCVPVRASCRIRLVSCGVASPYRALLQCMVALARVKSRFSHGLMRASLQARDLERRRCTPS